jgi:hypothetical protein
MRLGHQFRVDLGDGKGPIPLSDDGVRERVQEVYGRVLLNRSEGMALRVRLGFILNQVRDQFGHGLWDHFLDQYLGIHAKVARYCMRRARELAGPDGSIDPARTASGTRGTRAREKTEREQLRHSSRNRSGDPNGYTSTELDILIGRPSAHPETSGAGNGGVGEVAPVHPWPGRVESPGHSTVARMAIGAPPNAALSGDPAIGGRFGQRVTQLRLDAFYAIAERERTLERELLGAGGERARLCEEAKARYVGELERLCGEAI